MKLIHWYRLYKFASSGDGESLKEYAKMMPAEEAKSLRTKSPLLFKTISLLARFALRNKVSPKGEPIPKEHEKYYQESDLIFAKLLTLNLRVLENQSNWNVLNKIDNSSQGMFLAVEKEDDRYDGFEDALQWNTYYATALIRILPFYSGENARLIKRTINGLLDGIEQCFNDDHALIRHPLKSIKYDLEPISQDMVSGIAQLLLAVDEDDYINFPKLVDIKSKTIDVFTKSDYCLMYPDGTANSYDLSPNPIYNYPKSFIYTALRMIDGKFDSTDKSIVTSMLRIPPYEAKLPQDRSMYGTIVTMNALEAIALNDRDILLEAIEFGEYLANRSYELNPEIDSIMCSLYREAGYKTKMEEYAKRTIKGLSSCLDIGIEKSRDTQVIDPIKGNHPRPPKLRRVDDWFWQRRAYRTGNGTDKVANMVEIAGPLARVAPVYYYPIQPRK